MPRITGAAVGFSLNTFAAAMLALFIGLSVGLPMPYWAMTTAYIVSQPLSGAVRSKALFRLAGTVIGAAAAVALVPNLINSPMLLSLALALWVGVCLTISLLDRTPRSYLLMLAGYTAAIIGFPSVNHPEAIFDTAVARVVEIGLGIICATVVHSLVFPRPVGETVKQRLSVWMADADRWALDILQARDASVIAADRRHLAAAASEIQILATHLPFDTSNLRETTGHVRALHDRMLLLIPLLSGLSERMVALTDHRDDETRTLIDATAAWISAGCDPVEAETLAARVRVLAAARVGDDWTTLLTESLLIRLGELIDLGAESHALLTHINLPDAVLAVGLQGVVDGVASRPMHTDLPMAVLSGVAAALAVMAPCALWILGGWGDGATAAVMAAVFCCFFAALDDPVPEILNFGAFLLAGLPLGALYLITILPTIDSFPMLCAVMAPPLLLLGLLIPDPRFGGMAMPIVMGFLNSIALQESFRPDFASFMNVNLGQFVGLLSAVFVTASIRSMGVDAAIQRLVSQTWKGVASLARAHAAPSHAEFAARLVDRLGLLTPKLAATGTGHGDRIADAALRDLRVGMNLVAIQQVRPHLGGETKAGVESLLALTGEHYLARRPGPPRRIDHALLLHLDAALRLAMRSRTATTGAVVSALVGLRLNLFPAAAAFAPTRAPENRS